MRAIVQHGPEDLRLEDRPMPEPGPGEVLVRVLANGICGSDLHFWKHALYGNDVILGHEISGQVEAVGAGVESVAVGSVGAVHAGIHCGVCDRCQAGMYYYCRAGQSIGTGGPHGGLAEYLVAPAENFLTASKPFDPAVMTFSEPIANGLRCLAFPEAHEAESAVVIGAGPLGLSCLIAARNAGVKRVWVIEGRPRRRDAALALGAERVLHPFDEDVKGALRDTFPQGVDLVVEAVGLPETIQSTFLMVRPHGNVVIMGVNLGGVELYPGIWMLKELTIRSSIGCDAPEHREALDLITSGRVDATPLVTRRIGLEDVPEAIEELAAGADEVKVVVEHARS